MNSEVRFSCFRLIWMVALVFGLSTSTQAAMAQDYDVVIFNGRVMDPETMYDAIANVGIKDGRIATITGDQISGTETIDATGRVVAPGFIDLHAHGQNIGDYRMQAMQGVTTMLELESGVLPIAADRQVPFEDAWRFILKLGAAAHGYGSAAARLEMFLQRLSQRLGYQGAFRSTPSEIVFALRESLDRPQRVEFMATPPPGLNLYKLARVGDLLDEVEDGTVSLAEASVRLDAIDRTPPPWGHAANAISYVLVGLGVAGLLGGGWSDILYSMMFGAMVYGMVALSGRMGPGAGELVAQHVVSGTANLMSGLVCLVKQFAGGWLGVTVVSSIVPVAAGSPAAPVDPTWLWLIVPLLIVGLCVVFQTSRRDLPWAIVVCLIAYLGIMAGSAVFDSNLGNLLGTIVAVVCANLWARRTGRPTSIVLIPAIVLLVSGSIGFRGLASIAAGDLVVGGQQFLQMFVVALTILAGIIVGNTMVRPEPTMYNRRECRGVLERSPCPSTRRNFLASRPVRQGKSGDLLWRYQMLCPSLKPLSLTAAALIMFSWPLSAQGDEYVHSSGPETFTHEELVELSEDKEHSPELAGKLDAILTTPFINNEAYYSGAKPHRPVVEGLGPSLRAVFWNVERGQELDNIILLLTDEEGFLEKVASEGKQAVERRAFEADSSEDDAGDTKPGQDAEAPDMAKLREYIDILQSTDLFILNEVDWGLKRTDYRHVIHELGEALEMNWAYGVEFVEVDPKRIGTEYRNWDQDQETQKLAEEYFGVDVERLRALHGSAILSRYPIRKAELVRFESGVYDWYKEEKKMRVTEAGIRKGLRVIGDHATREMRRGGRMFLVVELDVPDLPEGRVTVATPHLENKTMPRNRRLQMEEVLEHLKDVHHPVIIAGDLNTSSGNPEAFKLERYFWRKVSDYEFWTHKGVLYATGWGAVFGTAKFAFNFLRNGYDPTVKHVPYLAPNREAQVFEAVERFRFSDGTTFDFRGERERTSDRLSGTLANSNERGQKGFEHTYNYVVRAGPVGRYKLDWFFIKAYAEHPRDRSGSYRFAPHYGRTMIEVNRVLAEHLSDHHPMSVDLPFQEPSSGKTRASETAMHAGGSDRQK